MKKDSNKSKYDEDLMKRIEKMSMKEKWQILEERTKEGLIGEEIAIVLFGEERTKELLSSRTKH